MSVYIIIILVTTAIGIINTIYLTYCCITKKVVKCLFLPAQMCFKVQYSKYSRTFAVPNPYLGLVMLLAILVFAVLFINSITPFWVIFAIISAGFLFSLYFTFIQTYVLKAFCTWCIVSALVFAVLFIVSSIKMLN